MLCCPQCILEDIYFYRNIIVIFFNTCFNAIVGEILLLYQVMMVLLPTESEPVIYMIRKLYMYAVICFVRCMKYLYSLKQKLWYIFFVRFLTFIESASEGKRPFLAY